MFIKFDKNKFISIKNQKKRNQSINEPFCVCMLHISISQYHNTKQQVHIISFICFIFSLFIILSIQISLNYIKYIETKFKHLVTQKLFVDLFPDCNENLVISCIIFLKTYIDVKSVIRKFSIRDTYVLLNSIINESETLLKLGMQLYPTLLHNHTASLTI